MFYMLSLLMNSLMSNFETHHTVFLCFVEEEKQFSLKLKHLKNVKQEHILTKLSRKNKGIGYTFRCIINLFILNPFKKSSSNAD